MKKIRNIFYTVMLALCAMNLTACDDEETYDFPGDPYNRVYILNHSNSYRIIQTPISSISDVDFSLSVNCKSNAQGAITAAVEIDNSLIADYNKQHGTRYEEMPAAAISIENAVMTIPDGEMVSTETLHLTMSDNESAVSGLRSENGYLIPLRLVSTEGGEAQMSTNLYTAYVIVTVMEDNVNHDATDNDITGTLVADQAGWSATTNGEVQSWYDPINCLFDGTTNTSVYISGSRGASLSLDVNMGKPYTFDAITLFNYSSWSGKQGCLVNGTEIYTSNDGTSWKSVGEVTGNTASNCVFYAPITTQYIRLMIPDSNGYGAYLMAAVFNVYAK